jgi:hypothetical protein
VKPAERILATTKAALAPIAIYALPRYEAPTHPLLWLLVAAGGAFFLPIMTDWARTWIGGRVWAWVNSVLLALILIWPQTPLWFAVVGVAFTAAVCAMRAWHQPCDAGAL